MIFDHHAPYRVSLQPLAVNVLPTSQPLENGHEECEFQSRAAIFSVQSPIVNPGLHRVCVDDG